MDRRPNQALLDRAVISSAQFDESLNGIGGSALVGDLNSTGIPIPTSSTSAQNERYLFRLCGAVVPDRSVCVVRYLRQLLYIGAEVESEEGQADETWKFEIPVLDPLWRFPDGNVSWHLVKHNPGRPGQTLFPGFPGQPQYSQRTDMTTPALLASSPADLGYTPLGGGVPPGVGVGGLATFRDIRYPWLARDHYLGLQIQGPCTIQFYASVYQTDPDNRPNKPVAIEQAALRREDVFVLNYPNAVYTRVGGSMEVDMISTEEAAGYPISS